VDMRQRPSIVSAPLGRLIEWHDGTRKPGRELMDVRCSAGTTGCRPVVRRWWLGLVVAAVSLVVLLPRSAGALALDEDQNFNLRLHLYSQLSLAMQDSQQYVTSPEKFTGQMMQNRNFFNPELETKFTSFLPNGWVNDFSGRLALWGFYDGLYDYG